MTTTYIKKSCPSCGYSVSATIRGYVKEPIGVPLARCPKCEKIFRDGDRKEWVQMSPSQKYAAICPRGMAYAIVLGFVVFLLANKIFENILGKLPSTLFPIVIISILVIAIHEMRYMIISIAVNNSDEFRKAYVQSILRSRNKEYRRILERMGPIYGEDLPKKLHFSEGNSKIIECQLRSKQCVDIDIPSLDDSIIEAK